MNESDPLDICGRKTGRKSRDELVRTLLCTVNADFAQQVSAPKGLLQQLEYFSFPTVRSVPILLTWKAKLTG